MTAPQPLHLSRRHGSYTYHRDSQEAADALADRLHEAIAGALGRTVQEPTKAPGRPASDPARTATPVRARRSDSCSVSFASMTASARASVQLVPLAQLRPAQWNPRSITEERFKNLCRAIEADPEFLWSRPILARADGEIYAGNHRYRAAESSAYGYNLRSR